MSFQRNPFGYPTFPAQPLSRPPNPPPGPWLPLGPSPNFSPIVGALSGAGGFGSPNPMTPELVQALGGMEPLSAEAAKNLFDPAKEGERLRKHGIIGYLPNMLEEDIGGLAREFDAKSANLREKIGRFLYGDEAYAKPEGTWEEGPLGPVQTAGSEVLAGLGGGGGPQGMGGVGMPPRGKGYDFGPMTEALGRSDEERRAIFERFDREARPLAPEERPEGEPINRLLLGLAGGAAAVGDTPWNIGRTLAAAGSGGLGELTELDREVRAESDAYNKEFQAFERDAAQLGHQMAREKTAEVMLLERAKMDEFNRQAQLAMDEYQARLGARSLYYDSASGQVIMTDKATGQVQTQQVSNIPLLLAQMKMMKALGGGTAQLFTAAGKTAKLDPVQRPIEAFAVAVMNGYGWPIEQVDQKIMEQMKEQDEDAYNIFNAALQSGDKGALERLQQERYFWAANLGNSLMQSGQGDVVMGVLNNIFQTNQAGAMRLLEELNAEFGRASSGTR